MNTASEAARALVKRRWAKTTKKQRVAHSKMMKAAQMAKNKEKLAV